VGVLWLLRWCSARFRGWRLSDRRAWREGVLSLKHRRCNETKKYHPAQQSPHENDWLPGNENPHGRTSGDEEWLTVDTIILRRLRHVFANILLVATSRTRSKQHFEIVAPPKCSEQAYSKSRPLQVSLPQAEEIRTRRDAGQIDVGCQYHNVIFQFGRCTRPKNFCAALIEER
jgi:hypothetical protein